MSRPPHPPAAMADASGPSDQAGWERQWQRDTATEWFEHEGFQTEALARFAALAPFLAPILDVGCGRGGLMAQLAKQGLEPVFGSDIALNPLHQAPSGHVVQADCRSLPFADGAVGSILSVLMLEHIADYETFLDEARRVLRSGGRLYLLFPNRYSAVTPVVALKRLLGRGGAIPYHRPLAPGRICQQLQNGGFHVVRQDYLSIGDYRGGAARLVSALIRRLLPSCCREEALIVAEKI